MINKCFNLSLCFYFQFFSLGFSLCVCVCTSFGCVFSFWNAPEVSTWVSVSVSFWISRTLSYGRAWTDQASSHLYVQLYLLIHIHYYFYYCGTHAIITIHFRVVLVSFRFCSLFLSVCFAHKNSRNFVAIATNCLSTAKKCINIQMYSCCFPLISPPLHLCSLTLSLLNGGSSIRLKYILCAHSENISMILYKMHNAFSCFRRCVCRLLLSLANKYYSGCFLMPFLCVWSFSSI